MIACFCRTFGLEVLLTVNIERALSVRCAPAVACRGSYSVLTISYAHIVIRSCHVVPSAPPVCKLSSFVTEC